MASDRELKDWLKKLGHPELLAMFLSRGFDDLQFMVSLHTQVIHLKRSIL
jgi:hypothetical protein